MLCLVLLVGFSLGLKLGVLFGRFWISEILILAGPAMLCVRAFRIARDAGWRVFVSSRTFAFGVLLYAAGQLLHAVWV